ncbi:hypothetical protein HLB42_20110 (plasmid) [Deinococcus sp. D7000]|nr:hypothetical protein HLB42_20110 [Deinococcus sp. D7000]
MSQVQDAATQGDYGGSIAVFRALASPTPLDLRWVGISLMHEMHLPEAELRLRQAIAGGDVAAGIFLSAVQLLNRTIDHALVTLEAIDPAALPDAEAALWHRERVRVGWLLGDARDALLERAEQAWRLSSDAPERVQVSVVTLLGQLHGHFGEHGRALAYLDFAAEYAQPRQREYVALCRATSLIALGRFDEAREQLDSITSASVAPLREIKRGQWLRGQGRWAEAQSTLEALLTGEAGAFLDQLMVFPELLPLVTASGQDALARQYLSRADHLKGDGDAYSRLLVDHRAGQWLSSQGDPQGVLRLQRAADGLEQAGHLVRVISVWLALAEAQPERRPQHLRHAAHLAAQVGTPPLLTPEWPLLPETRQHLLTLPETAFERLTLLGKSPAPALILKTLGSAELWLDGGRIRFRLGRAVEVLSYLRRNGAVTLKDVQRDLFPEVPAQRSRNYFHQVRVDIAARVPGLIIGFEAVQGRYRLQGEAALVWDVEELEAALRRGAWPQPAPENVVFLPTAGSEWAQGERERLSRWITQVGLETMEDWFQAGQYDKCISLADRLLPLDPLDEGLHTFLLNATYQVKGRAAARILFRESAATFIREVGEVPPFLERLVGQWAVN